LYAEDVEDFTGKQYISSDAFDFRIERNKGYVNHIIALGQGQLEERQVVHRYLDENNQVSTTQHFFGADEIAEIYNYGNVESLEDLIKATEERLLEGVVNDNINITINEILADIGDKFAAHDEETGIETVQYIDSKIITATDTDFSINYTAGIIKVVKVEGVNELEDYATNLQLNNVKENLSAFSQTVLNQIDNLQEQIDGNITSFFYDYEPTTSNIPASEWTTDEEKNNHLGDLFYWQSTGYCYRYQKDGNTYYWQRISDEDISAALEVANAAQDTADSKRRVFFTTPIPPYDEGDLWTQGANGDILRCHTAKTKDDAYSINDWVLSSKYTDDTTANVARGEAADAQATADEAQNIAKTKRRVFVTTPVPPYDIGDLWTDGSDLWRCQVNKASGSYSASDWVLATNYVDSGEVSTAVSALRNDLEAQIDGKLNTFAQSTNPATGWTADEQKEHHGDLWFYTGTSNLTVDGITIKPSETYQYNGTTGKWTSYDVPTTSLFDYADGKSTIYYGTTSGTYANVEDGDYLVDATDGSTYRRENNAWTKVTDYATSISTAISNLKTDLEGQIDAKIETWVQSTNPASAWTTTALKTEHNGDLWFYTGTSNITVNSVTIKPSCSYQYNGSTNKWVAYNNASKSLFDYADGKSTVFYGTTSGTYTGVETGDYLVDSTDGCTYRYNGSTWVKVTDYASAIDDLDDSLNQQEVFNRLTNNSQNEGVYLENGHLYINGSMVKANSIEGTSIKTNTITVGSLQDGNNYSTTTQMNDAIGTAVENIEIGGRNLIRNTLNPSIDPQESRPNINGYTDTGYSFGANSAGFSTAEHGLKYTCNTAIVPYIAFGVNSASTISMNGLEAGKTYTLSFDWSAKLYSGATDADGTTYLRIYLRYLVSGGTATESIFENLHIFLNADRSDRKVTISDRCEWTFTIPETAVGVNFLLRTNSNTASYFATGDFLEMRNIKLEEGNKSTAWSSAPEDINTAIDDIDIGGRNLLQDTNAPSLTKVAAKGNRYWSNNSTMSANGSSEIVVLSDTPVNGITYGAEHICTATGGNNHALAFYSGSANYIPFTKGTTYTASFWAKSSVTGAKTIFTISDYATVVESSDEREQVISVANTWTHITHTFKYIGDNASKIVYFGFQYNVIGTMQCCGYKLEIGNKATDWTPAPEDIAEEGGRTATSFITYINAQDGIKVHNSDDTSDYVQINSDAISMWRAGTEVTKIEDATITLGKTNDTHTVISSGGYDIVQNSGSSQETIAHFGYGSGASATGTDTKPYVTLGTRMANYGVGNYSVAEGVSVIASGYASHAEGNASYASASYAHAEGHSSHASGYASHAEGASYATASCAHSEGVSSSTLGATAYCSHSEGYYTKASDRGAHSEGEYTIAFNKYAHAEGYYSEAGGEASHASGTYTRAMQDNQTAIGKYNSDDLNAALIIGNGADRWSRSNALTVDWQGNVFASGDVYTGGADSSSGTKLVGAFYGTCSTAAATVAKVITITDNNFVLKTGTIIGVKFTYTNTASSPTFNVNGSGAKSVWYNTAQITTGSLAYAGYANRTMYYMYDGTYWVFMSWSYHPTYSTMSLTEANTGTATTARFMSAKNLNDWMNTVSTYAYTTFTYNTGFTYYEASGNNMPYAHKWHRMVQLEGAFKCSTAQTSTGTKSIGKVPSGCEPLATVRRVQQGSNQNRFMLIIGTDGTISIERYGVATDTAIPSGAWLNIACTYISAS